MRNEIDYWRNELKNATQHFVKTSRRLENRLDEIGYVTKNSEAEMVSIAIKNRIPFA
ncbi:hypothetical protein [Candidatus Parabeggiatoa sp. HSG14]|uniref:hypothetical protein n=1 Tax=Candidatus Parabeggiatoa sp. HSG14 TaxID=3055593 RepID=UPI0025A6BF9D|nr:hypothetical protein [Thiotrichales bacterium HSG14]